MTTVRTLAFGLVGPGVLITEVPAPPVVDLPVLSLDRALDWRRDVRRSARFRVRRFRLERYALTIATAAHMDMAREWGEFLEPGELRYGARRTMLVYVEVAP